MGEFVGSAGALGVQSGMTLISGVVSLLALGLYALFSDSNENNDDDDSSPGGGLMQPVA
ncbi:hypothetical protein IQ216_12780 [Cyanobium sp. LEGE 06143]|nr:hypothetical protein [Cyanobium sp. LEGE 06143]